MEARKCDWADAEGWAHVGASAWMICVVQGTMRDAKEKGKRESEGGGRSLEKRRREGDIKLEIRKREMKIERERRDQERKRERGVKREGSRDQETESE